MSIIATSQRPIRTQPAPAPSTSHREFPVRFTLSGTSRFWLRRPQNSYRWFGLGTLLVDERGVRVTARRLTLLGLYRTVLFILPSEIRQVYREGNSIRVDLRDGQFFRCWAENVLAAAEIVNRFPTRRTVELETAAVKLLPAVEAYRRAWWLVLAVAILGAIAWVGVARLLGQQGTPLQAPPVAPSSVPAPRTVGTLENRRQLEKYSQRFDALTVQFGSAFDALQRGNLSQSEFVDGLDKWLLPQWDELDAELQGSDQRELRAIIGAWRRALTTYAHGLRVHDANEVWSAFGYLREAEQYEQQVRKLYEDGTP